MEKKNYNIGDKVSFTVAESTITGRVTDILEMGYAGNENNVYEVTTDLGVFHLNHYGIPLGSGDVEKTNLPNDMEIEE